MDRYEKFINEKAKQKRNFLGKMFFPRTPVLLLDISESKKIDKKCRDLLEGLSALGVHTLVVSENDGLKGHEGGTTVRYIPIEKKSAASLAADFIVTFDKNVNTVWSAGGVPISQYNGEKTLDYNPIEEEGNGFYFKNPTTWEIFAAIVRALETYRFPYDWENLIRIILKSK